MERIHAAFSCGVIIWTMADCQSIILPSLLLLPESILADDHLTSELAKGIQSTDELLHPPFLVLMSCE